MKNITISTANSETYSSISNFFIDYYMTEANGEFVKVYLYLVRLLSNNSAVTVAGIADHFNLTENDICRAIKYWISRDVLRLNYDGRGRLSGIVLLPLHAPVLNTKLETDAVSILRSANYTEDPEMPSNVVRYTAPIEAAEPEASYEDTLEAGTVLVAPPKPRFTQSYINDKLKDQDWEDVVYSVETIWGKQISASDTNTLLYIYDTLKFDVSLIEYLIDYCEKMGKKNCRYMEAVAIAWYKDGIKTKQQAKEQVSLTSGITGIVFKALGIRRSNPSNIELAYINTWNKDFGFTPELISLACDKAVLAKPSSVNFAYINGILENWHKNKVKTKEDVEMLEKTFAAKQNEKDSNTVAPATNKVSSFANFKQAKLDDELDEMEHLLLKEVNKK